MYRMYRLNRRLSGLVFFAAAAAAAGPSSMATPQEVPGIEPEMPSVTDVRDLLETARAVGTFETFLLAIETSELTEALRKDGPFTIFAPTDVAFAKLPEGDLEALLKPENRQQLIAVLLYHVAPQRVFVDYAVAEGEVETLLEQQFLRFRPTEEGSVLINGNAEVIVADIHASNGMLHAIDTLLIPPPVEDGPPMEPRPAE